MAEAASFMRTPAQSRSSPTPEARKASGPGAPVGKTLPPRPAGLTPQRSQHFPPALVPQRTPLVVSGYEAAGEGRVGGRRAGPRRDLILAITGPN